jgi:glutamate/tyrosine decarboxylase-like PLP-dependent enzyme
VVLVSEAGHYSSLNAAAWLGIGQDNVLAVPTLPDQSIDLAALDAAARQAVGQGRRIAGLVATLGSTDAFALDDLAGIHAWRERLVDELRLDYRPHLHADAVIGWAWSVFNDYDFAANELGFRGRTVRALAAAQRHVQHLRLADSLGVDFHKTGYVPYVSSLFLLADGQDFGLIARTRDSMPYLYQSGQHHPGMYTLETTRSAVGVMAALANLLLLGKQGYRALLGHAVEMAEVLREKLESHPNLTVLNGDNVGPVTLFRAYPDGVDTFRVKELERSQASYREQLRAHNDYNRRLFERLHARALTGEGVVLSLTNCYRTSAQGEPIAALKSYVLSPFAEEQQMQSILDHTLAARAALPGGLGAAPHQL